MRSRRRFSFSRAKKKRKKSYFKIISRAPKIEQTRVKKKKGGKVTNYFYNFIESARYFISKGFPRLFCIILYKIQFDCLALIHRTKYEIRVAIRRNRRVSVLEKKLKIRKLDQFPNRWKKKCSCASKAKRKSRVVTVNAASYILTNALGAASVGQMKQWFYG